MTSQMPEIQVAWIGLAGTALTLVSGLAGMALKRWLDVHIAPAKEREAVLKGMESTRIVYQLMHEINEATSAERVVLFAGHDSGGYPRPHANFWVTALHWVVSDESKQKTIALRDYQNIAVDAHYIQMLLTAEANGVVEIVTDEMPECQLRDYYKAEGVTSSKVYFIGIKDRKFIYMSAAVYGGLFTDAEKMILRRKVERIRYEVNQVAK